MIRKEARRLQEKKKSEHRSKDMPAEMSSKVLFLSLLHAKLIGIILKYIHCADFDYL